MASWRADRSGPALRTVSTSTSRQRSSACVGLSSAILGPSTATSADSRSLRLKKRKGATPARARRIADGRHFIDFLGDDELSSPTPAEARGDECVERAQAQRLAAFRPAGTAALVPGVGVDMHPGRALADELLEVERRGD